MLRPGRRLRGRLWLLQLQRGLTSEGRQGCSVARYFYGAFLRDSPERPVGKIWFVVWGLKLHWGQTSVSEMPMPHLWGFRREYSPERSWDCVVRKCRGRALSVQDMLGEGCSKTLYRSAGEVVGNGGSVNTADG